MGETTATNRSAAGSKAYYTTSHSFGTGTTSTLALLIWRALSDNLLEHQAPMTGEELSKLVGITEEQVDALFAQAYYKRHYGFRRFDTLEEWEAWARSTGVLYSAELHGVPGDEPEEDVEDEDEETEE
ncbi:MAG TPA: hypothetical protein VGK74_16470 [Symbiobacteriaceae bacterium]